MLKKKSYRHRSITQDDAPLVRDWRNREHIRKYMYSDHIIGEKEHGEWMQKILPAAENYRIFEYEHQPVGLAALYDIHVEHKRCCWGIYLGEPAAPKGMGSQMAALMLDYVFLERGFHKLCSEVFCFNEKAAAMYRNLGFMQEAIFKEHCIKSNAYEDVLGLALFDHEWKRNREAVHDKIFKA